MIRRSKWPFASECDDGTYATTAASPQNTTGTEKPAPSFAEIDAYAPGGINGIDRHIGHIRIGIDPAPQSDRIALDIAPRVRVVVAGMIVMQLGVLVEELPREAEIIAERARRRAVAERAKRQAERFGGLETDEQFDLHGLLHRQVGGLFAPQDAADIGSGHTTWFREVGAITHQTADGSGPANLIPVESIEV